MKSDAVAAFIFLAMIAVYSLFPIEVTAENLHQKFGASWSCKMISAEKDSLYNACQACESQGSEFDKLSETGGRCLPKYSLRGREPSPAMMELEEKQRQIDDRMRQRAIDEINAGKRIARQQAQRWLDSDVSGYPYW